ncbi:hypothetical protein [Bradyrhizobium canariense]|uniref:hypothetical protein n=1 Tax=Bradyrhizobium canariense TaxID=255045 RepID=UPI001177C268|nr:hypothetical protein [Bradyrhizobium canariense]
MPIQLPDISTDEGVLSRLIIAECQNPGYASYNQADGQFSFRLMQATVFNRLNNNPGQFGARGATTYADIITAPAQFAGFSKSGGTVKLSAAVSSRIDDVMSKANSGAAGPYSQFVQDILAQVNGAINDPLAAVTSIDGTAVETGVYGWRTSGSGSPGARYIAVPQQFGGLILGNQFYMLKADTAVADLSSAPEV